jgi:hypothetical protein
LRRDVEVRAGEVRATQKKKKKKTRGRRKKEPADKAAKTSQADKAEAAAQSAEDGEAQLPDTALLWHDVTAYCQVSQAHRQPLQYTRLMTQLRSLNPPRPSHCYPLHTQAGLPSCLDAPTLKSALTALLSNTTTTTSTTTTSPPFVVTVAPASIHKAVAHLVPAELHAAMSPPESPDHACATWTRFHVYVTTDVWPARAESKEALGVLKGACGGLGGQASGLREELQRRVAEGVRLCDVAVKQVCSS